MKFEQIEVNQLFKMNDVYWRKIGYNIAISSDNDEVITVDQNQCVTLTSECYETDYKYER
jgi:hypothetical protein